MRNIYTYFLFYNCSIPVTSASNCILFSLDSKEYSDWDLFAEDQQVERPDSAGQLTNDRVVSQ